jgi:hypothetical protein
MSKSLELFYDDEVERCIYEELNLINNHDIVDCIICLQLILPSEFITANHEDKNHPRKTIMHPSGYHKECWEHYITKFDTCPLCRMIIITKDDPLSDHIRPHIRPHVGPHVGHQVIEQYTREQMQILEALLFLSTLGHSIYISPHSNYYLNGLKSTVSFFITCRTMATYLRQFATSRVRFLFCFWICYGLISNFIDSYIIVVETITNNNYE